MNLVQKITGHYRSFDGTEIYYEIRGDSNPDESPIFLCYGIGCLSNHWLPQIRYFSKTHQTIVFDYRGHHKSQKPFDKNQMSVDALARDLIGLIEHFHFTKAHLWGHSFGAQVLLRAYDLRPDLVKSLIFINGFASDPISGMFGSGLASKAFQLAKNGFDLAPSTLSFVWKKAINNPITVFSTALLGGFNIQLTALKDIEIYLKGVATLDLEAFITLFEDMIRYDGRPVFEKIEVPTLIIGGKKDAVTPLSYQQEMHDRIRGSQFMMVPYGSHCTQLDMPDMVNLRIDKFMKELRE